MKGNSTFKTRTRSGFTLLEVVIALAVFGFLIGGLLGFLPWGIEGVGKVRDQNIAYGLVDAIDVELERMGFSLVEAATKNLDDMYNPTSPPIESTEKFMLLLVAKNRGGGVAFEQVVSRENSAYLNNASNEKEGEMVDSFDKDAGGTVYFNRVNEHPVSLSGYENEDWKTPPHSYSWIPEAERYFLIKVSQFPFGHRHEHHPSNGYLALQVDIQWPYKLPVPPNGFRRVQEKYRSHFRFPFAMSR
ncbi:MAG: prepilin-type N-terminal cleavage/methylation domain-containing protein [Opitutales bacterium]|nr:prepilin-type N-terminal cleavage/methylation domain-containing protein [Opitutales bacterium]